jgi:cytochrome d ubiquinol oxidase subunit II
VVFVLIFLVHGALYLTWRVEGDLRKKAFYMAKVTWPVFLVCFLAYVALTFFWAFWPRLGQNFLASPLLFALPALCAVLFLASGWYMYFKDSPGKAFLASCGGILTLTLTGVMGMFPNLIPSREAADGSLTLANASSSELTLTIMLVVAVVMVPTVIVYQIWAHKKMAWPIKADY